MDLPEEHVDLHAIPVDEVDAPHAAWVTLTDGGRVDCRLTRVGPREWLATPVLPVGVGELKSGHVDRIPPHCAVSFAVAD